MAAQVHVRNKLSKYHEMSHSNQLKLLTQNNKKEINKAQQ